MNKLEYTSEQPTEPGWYFVSYKGNPLSPQMVNIYLSSSGLRVREYLSFGDIIPSSLVREWTYSGTRWAGPIQDPDFALPDIEVDEKITTRALAIKALRMLREASNSIHEAGMPMTYTMLALEKMMEHGLSEEEWKK